MKIAITGGIGSGKSYICSLLRGKGIEVYDCDTEAKRIMLTSESVRNRLTGAIGTEAYIGGKPNKAYIAAYLLKSAENARIINGIIHPAVADDFMRSGMNIMECAILFSSGFDRLVDKIVCVTAPMELRIQRIMQRDGISRKKAQEWINCQMSQKEMVSRSHYIIRSGDDEVRDSDINAILPLLRRTKTIRQIIR